MADDDVTALTGQVAEWARVELQLDPAAEVEVVEKVSNDPRCSPLVTEVTITPPGEQPFVLHIEHPLAEVTQIDILAALAFGH